MTSSNQSSTFPQVLEDLFTLPGEFIACLEWCRIPNGRMRRTLQTRRRHFFNKRVSMVNYVSPETRPDEMLVDESASATVRQLGDALTELEVHGHFFGECSLSLVLFSEDARTLDRSAAEAIKVLTSHDGALIDETYNLLNAWLAIVPGNSAHNLRRLALLETNYADLSILFTLDTGEPRSPHLQAEALAILETEHQTPYHFNLHVDDVGHTLVLGATGSGKSFLLNFLVMHAQKYEPLTVIFDLGHSYRKLATLLNGSYLALGLHHQDLRINPFALAPTSEHLHFLHAFVRVLLEGADRYRLSDLEDRELYDAVENVYVLDPAQRRLFTLANLLPRAMASRLSSASRAGHGDGVSRGLPPRGGPQVGPALEGRLGPLASRRIRRTTTCVLSAARSGASRHLVVGVDARSTTPRRATAQGGALCRQTRGDRRPAYGPLPRYPKPSTCAETVPRARGATSRDTTDARLRTDVADDPAPRPARRRHDSWRCGHRKNVRGHVPVCGPIARPAGIVTHRENRRAHARGERRLLHSSTAHPTAHGRTGDSVKIGARLAVLLQPCTTTSNRTRFGRGTAWSWLVPSAAPNVRRSAASRPRTPLRFGFGCRAARRLQRPASRFRSNVPRRLRAACGNAVQHAFRTDVLVDIGPMRAMAVADELPIGALRRCRFRQPP